MFWRQKHKNFQRQNTLKEAPNSLKIPACLSCLEVQFLDVVRSRWGWKNSNQQTSRISLKLNFWDACPSSFWCGFAITRPLRDRICVWIWGFGSHQRNQTHGLRQDRCIFHTWRFQKSRTIAATLDHLTQQDGAVRGKTDLLVEMQIPSDMPGTSQHQL